MTLRARISLDALRANLAVAGGEIVDVRTDAWGHGVAAVAAAALGAGAAGVVADEQDLATLREAGIAARDVRLSGEATLDPRRVYGLDEAAVPVLRLSGSVLSTKTLRAGEGVSYGYLYRAPSDTRVALVSGGYAQGVVRALGGASSVVIDGRPCPILGRVAMDVCVVEIGDADIRRGADAWFFGDPAAGHPPLGAWASATGMDSAELVTAVGLHTERTYA
jgi:alanine racemase